jgi:hypothetical protein
LSERVKNKEKKVVASENFVVATFQLSKKKKGAKRKFLISQGVLDIVRDWMIRLLLSRVERLCCWVVGKRR